MARQIGVVIDPLELDEKWVERVLEGGIDLLGSKMSNITII